MKVLIVHVFIIPNGNILFRDIFKNDADDVAFKFSHDIDLCLSASSSGSG